MSVRPLVSVAQILSVLAPTLAVTVAAAPAPAQELPLRPVVVALPDAFPDLDARAIIVQERVRDVVLLRRGDATAETLDVALRVLSREGPRRPQGKGAIIPVTGYVSDQPLSEERSRALSRLLTRLEQQVGTRLGSLGHGRWVTYEPR